MQTWPTHCLSLSKSRSYIKIEKYWSQLKSLKHYISYFPPFRKIPVYFYSIFSIVSPLNFFFITQPLKRFWWGIISKAFRKSQYIVMTKSPLCTCLLTLMFLYVLIMSTNLPGTNFIHPSIQFLWLPITVNYSEADQTGILMHLPKSLSKISIILSAFQSSGIDSDLKVIILFALNAHLTCKNFRVAGIRTWWCIAIS